MGLHGTTGTPIGSGGAPAPSVSSLVQPLPFTLLSLNRFAKVLGINPAHFWGASGESLSPKIMPVTSCEQIYYQYSWQDNDIVSRHDIALEIARAESDLFDVLGFHVAPKWIEEEHPYPRHHRRDVYNFGGDLRGLAKSIIARSGKISNVGARATSLIGVATTGTGSLAYSDEDGDGLYETATVSLASSVDINEVKVFYTGYGGQQEFEIREPRRAYASGGYIYLIFDSWLFIDPDLWETLPDEEGTPYIDIGTTGNFLTEVDVYREYVDDTADAIIFKWENAYVGCASCAGAGCEVCGTITQGGCLRIRDEDSGIVVPVPANYSADDGWAYANWTGNREPDRVAIYYKAGDQSQAYKLGRTHIPMPFEWEKVVAHLATARLERPLCGCTNLQTLAENLREDMTRTETGVAFFTTVDVVNNPFGTRRGEVEAWRKVTKLSTRRSSYAII